MESADRFAVRNIMASILSTHLTRDIAVVGMAEKAHPIAYSSISCVLMIFLVLFHYTDAIKFLEISQWASHYVLS